MSKKVKVIIAICIALLGMLIMISKLFDKQPTINTIEQTTLSNEGNTSVSSTNTTTKKITTKKVVKTTKKVVKKVSKSKINISYNRQEVIDYTHEQVVKRWGEKEWNSTYQIAMHESGFSPNSWNKKTTACGVFQACPCTKTIKNGYKDYYTNWKTQVNWGLDYITYKYKTPSNAWKYWQQHHSY